MKIEIDQSIKIENTSKTTYIAFSNSIKCIVSISAREKKKVQTFFRKVEKRKLFIPLAFTATIFLLIKNYLKEGMTIVIDKEYPGFEKFISLKLEELITQNSKHENYQIRFSLIGKKSGAHVVAYDAYKNKSKKKLILSQFWPKILLKL
jgi:hypothetical protein